MPPPPPPPPGAPPPPAPPALPKLGGAAGGLERKDLLKDIQSGARLKPTKTNDRSAPVVGSGKSATAATGPSSNDRSGGGGGNGDSRTDAQSSQFTGPLPGIGGLFAGGMPTLKKTKGGINTGRAPDPESPQKSAANGSSSSNNINNKFLNSSTSSLVSFLFDLYFHKNHLFHILYLIYERRHQYLVILSYHSLISQLWVIIVQITFKAKYHKDYI